MNKQKCKKYPPLRSFAWSNHLIKTLDQELIESTVQEWYDAKHRTASKDEIVFINSLKIEECPFCHSKNIVKNGHKKDGIQRYSCKECRMRFTPLTNTVFDARKIPISEWIEYLLHLFEFHSINSTAYDNRNSPTTAKYWLYKVFEVLKDIQNDIVLDGEIYLDETYLSKAKKDTVTKNGKKLDGLSRNKIGVGVACNGKKSIFIVTGTSKPYNLSTIRTYESHIAKGSTIIHDAEHSHNILVKNLQLKSIVYPLAKTRGLNDSDNPLYKVNHFHSLLKRFMKAHGGYDREHLQDWMNLFYFLMNEPQDKYSKVLKFIQLAVSSPKRVKYRDVMSKYHNK